MSERPNVNITSINQTGGITAHTVNTVHMGVPPRRMNASYAEDLKRAIPLSAKVSVEAVASDPEAFGFANEILDWLVANGYSNVDALGVTQVWGAPYQGHKIKMRSGEFVVFVGTNQ